MVRISDHAAMGGCGTTNASSGRTSFSTRGSTLASGVKSLRSGSHGACPANRPKRPRYRPRYAGAPRRLKYRAIRSRLQQNAMYFHAASLFRLFFMMHSRLPMLAEQPYLLSFFAASSCQRKGMTWSLSYLPYLSAADLNQSGGKPHAIPAVSSERNFVLGDCCSVRYMTSRPKRFSS